MSTDPPTELPELSTPDQLAAWLQLPVKTLYAWRHKGDGPPALKVGRHLRYRRADVLRWLDALAGPPPPPPRGGRR